MESNERMLLDLNKLSAKPVAVQQVDSDRSPVEKKERDRDAGRKSQQRTAGSR